MTTAYTRIVVNVYNSGNTPDELARIVRIALKLFANGESEVELDEHTGPCEHPEHHTSTL